MTDFKPGIARSLIAYMVLFSSIITLLITAIQLSWDYKNDINLIEDQLQQVEKVHLKTLSSSLWASDINDVKTHLEGIFRLRDMQFLEIKDAEKIWVSLGSKKSESVITRQYPLTHQHRGRNTEIGTLTVVASLSSVYQRLLDKVWMILVSNGVKTFLVAGFMLILFHLLITRHLTKIAEFAQSLDTKNLDRQLGLDRKRDKLKDSDELSMLVNAINQMQHNIKDSLAALKSSEKRIQIINSRLPGIVYQFKIDEKGNKSLPYVSPTVIKYIAVSAEDIMLDAGEWFDLVHPDDLPGLEKLMAESMVNLTTWEWGGRFVRKDGSTVWLHGSSTPERLEDNSTIWDGVFIDVTERKKNEAELNKYRLHLEELVEERTVDLSRAVDEAECANKAKSQFLSQMSHELRTPMNAILGFAQLFELDAEDLCTTHQEYIHEILVAGTHLLKLINEVLDLARIESGKMDVSLEKVHIADILQQCLPLVKTQADARQIALFDKISHRGYIIKADFSRLKQVLLNLLSNAVKYNCMNGNITLDAEVVDKQRLRVKVTDTGDGLTEKEISKLFRAFERLDTFENIEGTGIGLVISKQLVNLMGGTIGVESVKGQGCTFWTELELMREK